MSQQIIRVTKQFTFDMAHALHGYDGLCKNIHGHTYHLYVTIKGSVLQDELHPKNGMLIDFGDMKKIVHTQIVNTFDHALVLNGTANEHLNLAPHLKVQFEKVIYLDAQPTSENLITHFHALLAPHFNTEKQQLVYMKLVETPTSYAEWLLEDN